MQKIQKGISDYIKKMTTKDINSRAKGEKGKPKKLIRKNQNLKR